MDHLGDGPLDMPGGDYSDYVIDMGKPILIVSGPIPGTRLYKRQTVR